MEEETEKVAGSGSSDEPPAPQKKCHGISSLWLQVLVNIVLNLDAMTTGMCLGFTGVCLPQLRQDPNIQTSGSHISLMASLPALGGSTGALLLVPLAERMGRKGALTLAGTFSFLGWLGATLSFHVELLLACRFLIGMGMGASSGSRQVMVAELSQVHLRGVLSSLNLVALQLGLFLVYVLGMLLPWRAVCAVGCATALCFLVACRLLLPESPRYLLQNGREEAAARSLRRVRRGEVQEELQALQRGVASLRRSSPAVSSKLKTLRALASPGVLRPLAIMLLLTFTNRFSGAVGITTFAVDLFSVLGQHLLDRYLATLITGLVQLLLSVLGMVAVFYVRTRKMVLIAGLGMAVGLLFTAIYLHASPDGDGPAPWLPFLGVWLYLFFCIPGHSVALRVMGGELFPLRMRGALSSAFTCASFLISFASAQSFPSLLRELRPWGAFYLFATVAASGSCLGVLLAPDTSGKTLEEIEGTFAGKSPAHADVELPFQDGRAEADAAPQPTTPL